MKISLSKMPFLNKLPPELRGKPFKSFLIIAFLIAAFTYLIFTGSRETNTIRKSIKPSTVKKSAKETNDKDVGVLTGTLDTKAYISRIEKQYYDISNKFDLLNSRNVIEAGVICQSLRQLVQLILDGLRDPQIEFMKGRKLDLTEEISRRQLVRSH